MNFPFFYFAFGSRGSAFHNLPTRGAKLTKEAGRLMGGGLNVVRRYMPGCV
jgi:hypothetical protein